MEVIYQSQFQQIKHHKLLQYFEISWKDTEQMTDAEYQAEMTTQIDKAIKHRVYGYIVDSRQFYFRMSPQTQQWTIQLLAKLAQSGIRKIAFLVTPEVYLQVAIHQKKQPEEAQSLFQNRYFDDQEEAKEWLTRNIKIF